MNKKLLNTKSKRKQILFERTRLAFPHTHFEKKKYHFFLKTNPSKISAIHHFSLNE